MKQADVEILEKAQKILEEYRSMIKFDHCHHAEVDVIACELDRIIWDMKRDTGAPKVEVKDGT